MLVNIILRSNVVIIFVLNYSLGVSVNLGVVSFLKSMYNIRGEISVFNGMFGLIIFRANIIIVFFNEESLRGGGFLGRGIFC